MIGKRKKLQTMKKMTVLVEINFKSMAVPKISELFVTTQLVKVNGLF
jgi:hypothetical protein